MSADAETRAKVWRHPHVEERRSVRALLELIAKLIPEGGTMTDPMPLSDYATRLGYDVRTVWKAQVMLVDVGAIRVVGGGRGKKPAYELLLLEGAGAPPVLPLMGRAAPPRVRHASTLDRPLLDVIDVDERSPGEEVAPKVGSLDPTLAERSDLQIRRWAKGRISRSYVWLLGIVRRISRSDVALPLDVDDAHARATYNNLRTTTTSAAADAAPEKRKPPRCPFHGTVHAYCDGRVHVPTPFHEEELRKLPRRPGQTDAELDAEQFAIYAAVLAGIPEGTRILDKNEFAFWNRVLRGTTPTRRAWIPFRRPSPRVRQEGGASGWNCPHTPRCESGADGTAFVVCRDRQLAEARAERERKSG